MSTHDRPANSLGSASSAPICTANSLIDCTLFISYVHATCTNSGGSSNDHLIAHSSSDFGKSLSIVTAIGIWFPQPLCHSWGMIRSVSYSEEWQRQRDRIPESTQFVDRITVILLVCTDWLKTDWLTDEDPMLMRMGMAIKELSSP